MIYPFNLIKLHHDTFLVLDFKLFTIEMILVDARVVGILTTQDSKTIKDVNELGSLHFLSSLNN